MIRFLRARRSVVSWNRFECTWKCSQTLPYNRWRYNSTHTRCNQWPHALQPVEPRTSSLYGTRGLATSQATNSRTSKNATKSFSPAMRRSWLRETKASQNQCRTKHVKVSTGWAYLRRPNRWAATAKEPKVIETRTHLLPRWLVIRKGRTRDRASHDEVPTYRATLL